MQQLLKRMRFYSLKQSTRSFVRQRLSRSRSVGRLRLTLPRITLTLAYGLALLGNRQKSGTRQVNSVSCRS